MVYKKAVMDKEEYVKRSMCSDPRTFKYVQDRVFNQKAPFKEKSFFGFPNSYSELEVSAIWENALADGMNEGLKVGSIQGQLLDYNNSCKTPKQKEFIQRFELLANTYNCAFIYHPIEGMKVVDLNTRITEIKTMRITPENVVRLEPNQIFVFGSNLAGRHGKGAALIAYQEFGARYHQGVGMQGKSYAIPTKNLQLITLSIDEIKQYVEDFITFAKEFTSKEYLVTEIGCGLAGYKPEQIAPLFKDCLSLVNVFLPLSFYNILTYPKTNNDVF